MQIVSIQVGQPRECGRPDMSDPRDKPWRSGIFKNAVQGAVWLGATNLAGDGQADLENHGGPDKAVNVYPAEHYPFWARELELPELPRGAFGENFTTSGLLEEHVCVGDVFQLGAARVQISQPRQPCWKLARRWRQKELPLRVQQTGRTGWYLRVLAEGEVAAGMFGQLIDRPHPEWTVSEANRVMHDARHDLQATRALARCPSLSPSWRATLTRRAEQGLAAPVARRLEGVDEER